MKRKILSIFLSLAVALTMMPAIVLANDAGLNESAGKEQSSVETNVSIPTEEAGSVDGDEEISENSNGSENTEDVNVENNEQEKGAFKISNVGGVAQIGNETYSTLADAVEAANTATTAKEIVLLSDITLTDANGVSINDGKDITIDLAGHDITANFQNTKACAVFHIKNNGKLTMKDTGAEYGCVVLNSSTVGSWPTPNVATNVFTNEGTLVINGGYYENVGQGYCAYVVDSNSNTGNVELTVNGGKLVAQYCPIRTFLNNRNTTNKVLLKDGKFEGRYIAFIQQPSASTSSSVEFRVEGGTYSCKRTYNNPGKAFYIDVLNTAPIDFNISGGKFTNTDATQDWVAAEIAGSITPNMNIVVSGGYYSSNKINANYIANGYECVADTTVTGCSYKVQAKQVAKIGETTYPTLAAAVAEAKSGDTIKMLEDVVLENSIVIDKNITLDLAGKDITVDENWKGRSPTGQAAFYVKSDAKFIVNDTVGEGSIDTSENNNVYSAVIVTIGGNNDMNKCAELEVNGGLLKGYYYGVCTNGNRHNTKITINGGTLTGADNNNDATSIYHPDRGELVINGGTFRGYDGISIKGGTPVTITGGEFIATGNKVTPLSPGASGCNSVGSALYVEGNYGYGATVTVTGGKFRTNDEDAPAVLSLFNTESKATILLKSGLYSNQLDNSYIAEGCAAAKINGGYYHYIVGLGAKSTNNKLTAGKFNINPIAYVANGYTVEPSGNKNYPYEVKEKSKEQKEIVIEKPTEATVGKEITDPEEVLAAENAAKQADVTGVANALTEEGQDKIIGEAIKDGSPVTEDKVKYAKQVDIAITVKTEVTASKTTGTIGDEEKLLAFELEPYAVVTATDSEGNQVQSYEIKVDNDYLAKTSDKAINVKVGSKFKPEQVIHIRKDGINEAFEEGDNASFAKKTFKCKGSENDFIITVQITQFSELKLFASERYAKVTFAANGGRGEMEATSVSKEEKFTLPACGFTAPVGKEFSGWKIGDDVYKVGDKVDLNVNTTITAQWKALPNKVAVELLQAKTSGKKAVKLSWNSVPGATKYVVYGQKCGKKYKELKTTTGNTYTVKKIKGKKLKAHKTYKFYVVAYTSNGKVQSNSIHFITAKTQGKYANAKSITVNSSTLTLVKGKAATIKTTTKIYKNKKHIKKNHGVATRFISDCPTVATVSSNGVVTAKAPGTATIYVQDIGGLWTKTAVTVKGADN